MSVIVLSRSKSIEAPSAIVEADEKTCACLPMANSFKEIRDYYIDNYNSWNDSKIKKEFAERRQGHESGTNFQRLYQRLGKQ